MRRLLDFGRRVRVWLREDDPRPRRRELTVRQAVEVERYRGFVGF